MLFTSENDDHPCVAIATILNLPAGDGLVFEPGRAKRTRCRDLARDFHALTTSDDAVNPEWKYHRGPPRDSVGRR